MNITEGERYLGERIQVAGRPMYAFWKFCAARLMFVYLIAALLFVIFGWLTWWHIPAIMLLSYGFAHIIQTIVRRERPEYEKTTGFKLVVITYSFPSGHATESSAIALSLILLTSYPSPQIAFVFGAIFLLTVALISMARLVVGVHYVSDVLFGFVLGSLIAFGYAWALMG